MTPEHVPSQVFLAFPTKLTTLLMTIRIVDSSGGCMAFGNAFYACCYNLQELNPHIPDMHSLQVSPGVVSASAFVIFS